MKFSIAKQVLLDGLNKVVGIVASRPSMPILSNVLLEVTEGNLKLTTTTVELAIQASVPAMVEETGSYTLPAKKLQSIVREMQDGEVCVELNNNAVTLRCNRAIFKLYGLSADEFPPMPVFNDAREFEVPQAMLSKGLRYTEFAIATDDTRYVLNGLYTCFQEGKLTLVATDGRRLALFENELEFPESQQVCVILQNRTVPELQRLLGEAGTVQVRVTADQMAFDLGDTLLVTKLITGNYPNYKQVIPNPDRYKDRIERISIPAQELQEAVRRVSLLAAEKKNTVLFHITPGVLEVQSGSADVGEAREEVPLEYDGRDFSITFNAGYVIEPLKAVGEKDVSIDLIDASSPGVMRVEGEFLYVLMPMHTLD